MPARKLTSARTQKSMAARKLTRPHTQNSLASRKLTRARKLRDSSVSQATSARKKGSFEAFKRGSFFSSAHLPEQRFTPQQLQSAANAILHSH